MINNGSKVKSSVVVIVKQKNENTAACPSTLEAEIIRFGEFFGSTEEEIQTIENCME